MTLTVERPFRYLDGLRWRGTWTAGWSSPRRAGSPAELWVPAPRRGRRAIGRAGLIYSRFLIPHLPESEQTFRDMRALLRPNGVLSTSGSAEDAAPDQH